MEATQNSKGQIFYGMHFYPGVAEYQEAGKNPYRVFLNEDTIRSMDPTFAGRPVFVQHVDGVADDVDALRKDADGWVIESFYNSADGKHWVKFIVVSEKAEDVIRQGWKLSNCYIPKKFGASGVWNGVSYTKEIVGGEYEHLALVPNPRYEESVVMTPDEFKQYNEEKIVELKRLANKGKDNEMGLNFFKKTKVENDISEMSVVLPKSGREISIATLVKEADARFKNEDPAPSPSSQPPRLDPGGVAAMKKAFGNEEKDKDKDDHKGLADPSHKVKLFDGSYCNVAELVDKHKSMHEELEGLKKKKEDATEKEGDLKVEETEVDVEGDESAVDNKEGKDFAKGDTPSEMNEEDEDEDKKAKKKAMALVEHEDKEIEEAKKKNAKEKADKLRNASPVNAPSEVISVDLPEDKVARGKARYGSSN